MDVEELNQLKLTVKEAKITDIDFFKTCLKCGRTCYEENDIVQCFSCDLWIHKNVGCYTYGKFCLSCYQTKKLNVEDDINEGDINVNHRKYDAGNDNMSVFNTNTNSDNSDDHSISQTVVSQLCLTVFNKFNNNKSSDITCDKK